MDGKYSMFSKDQLGPYFLGKTKNTNYTKDKDEALEAPRTFTRSLAKQMQDKVAGLQWEIKKVLIVEEELKSCGGELATSYTYFMV